MGLNKCDICTALVGVLSVCLLCYFEPQPTPHTAKESVRWIAGMHYSVFAGKPGLHSHPPPPHPTLGCG
jgi:hypothetical protein